MALKKSMFAELALDWSFHQADPRLRLLIVDRIASRSERDKLDPMLLPESEWRISVCSDFLFFRLVMGNE
jgi:hypothetical protein